ncbi:S41 family peptidase [Ornithobacterium rhinotracheale]|nr:S41 family peptidase [Ornithobacterium rhinotracheale]MCK0205329.1 S41 family peptidase [Ornithobacterium rhinotracheale]
MKSLVLDLRDNPGGLVDAAQKIADEFLKEDQLIVYTQDKEGKKKFRYATGEGTFQKRPIYILINEGSASASEILQEPFKTKMQASSSGAEVMEKDWCKKK